MLDQEDMKWLAANATELNRFLQQATRQVDLARLRTGASEHLDSLNEQLELAARASQAIFDRITARILAGTGGSARPGGATPGSPAMPASAAQASVSTKMPVGEVAVNVEAASDSLILNPEGKRELILLVDDDQEVLECTGEILDFEDYRFITAKDGIEALQIYRRMGRKIDLVLLDYFLPVMDGDAVFDELKGIDPNVRVVLSSGFAEQAKVGSMLARGLHGFIPKPYTHQKLIEQIRSVLDA
jgi:CheY-like chemotaxis protein